MSIDPRQFHVFLYEGRPIEIMDLQTIPQDIVISFCLKIATIENKIKFCATKRDIQ